MTSITTWQCEKQSIQ